MSTMIPGYLGDSAIELRVGCGISPEINDRVHALDRFLALSGIPGVIETVPAYDTLVVHIDPDIISGSELTSVPHTTCARKSNATHRIPLVYGGESGPDLEHVARHCNLSPAAYVSRHERGQYRVYCLGFNPGFCYLGGLEPKLACPRLPSPRNRVPAGSVAVAGEQTGIYSLPTGGGWRIIGKTPLQLFDSRSDPPVLISPGDSVEFYSQCPDELASISATADDRPQRGTLAVTSVSGYASIQDQGRSGYRRWGIGSDGALDNSSLVMANMLVGNDPRAAAIEAFGYCKLEARAKMCVATTGGSDCIAVDGRRFPRGATVLACRGQTIEISPPQRGIVSYLAVSGGIDVPLWLGSRATNSAGAGGGHHGRPVMIGDVLPVGQSSFPPSDVQGLSLSPDILMGDHSGPIRVLPGPEDVSLVFPLQLTASAEFNRAGMRLARASMSPPQESLISCGVVPGTVQLPPDGRPVVLYSGCGTLGGYHRIMTVISADRDRLVRYRAGETITFDAASASEARRARIAYRQRLEQACSHLGYRCFDLATGTSIHHIIVKELKNY